MFMPRSCADQRHFLILGISKMTTHHPRQFPVILMTGKLP